MPAIRHDSMLLRILKDLQDVRSALRRVTVNLPLFDIANENTPAQLTANQDNYVPGNYDILRLSSSRPVIITGFRGGLKGRRLQLFNVGSYNIALSHQNLASNAENRFKFRNETAAFLEPSDTLTVYYDFTQQRWIEATQVFDFDLGNTFTTNSPPVGNYRDVAWSPSLELLVAVGTSGQKISSSPDGITWTGETNPRAGALWEGIDWSPSLGLFCAVSRETTAGSAGNKVMTSPDGKNWTMQASAEATDLDRWRGVAWSADLSLFVAVGNDTAGNNDFMTSPDGVNWTLQTAPAVGGNPDWYDVVWADDLGLFIATHTSATNPMSATSPDGTTWAGRNFPSTANLEEKSLAWSDYLDRVIAVGLSGADGRIFSSDNGTSWTLRNSETGVQWNCAAWSSSLRVFLVLDDTGTYAAQSPDGITWTLIDGPGSLINSIIWVEELAQFIGVGNNVVITAP